MNEIELTRKGGFGGSDASMFYKVGLKGLNSLSYSDKRRIAVAVWTVEYVPTVKTPAMNAGHYFEDFLSTMGNLKSYEREKLLESKEIKPRNFRIFAHADFWGEENRQVVEAKFAQTTTDDVLNRYKAQLNWYYMLGAKHVRLMHGIGSVDPFDVKDMFLVNVEKSQKIIDILHNGIQLIDEYIDTFTFAPKEEITEADLLPYENEDVRELTMLLSEAKRATEQAEELKARMLAMFKMYGIKSLKSDNYSITYCEPSVTSTLDKSKLFSEHPEINEADYLKHTPKKEFLKIQLK